MMMRLPFLISLIIVAGIAMTSCGGNESASKATTEIVKVDAATAATVSGTVLFDGTPPARTDVSMESDPACAAGHEGLTDDVTQAVLVTDGKLANVFVYVSEGIKGSTTPPDAPAVIDQKGCRYHPHVIGVVAGQKVEFRNSDATLHNVHSEAKVNRAFNIAQATQGKVDTKVFSEPEQMIPIVCDVHGWMKSYIGVLPHNFFAVTSMDGHFTLPPLPPGTYTISAWHEKYGVKTQAVTVGAKESKEITFTYSDSAPAQ